VTRSVAPPGPGKALGNPAAGLQINGDIQEAREIFGLEVSAYVSRQTRKSHSGGRRFDPDQLHKFHQQLMTQLDFGVRKLFSGVRVSFPMPRPVQAGKAQRFVQCRLTSMKIRR
jgi:hypothetical protein